jgi:hypothetical protein
MRIIVGMIVIHGSMTFQGVEIVEEEFARGRVRDGSGVEALHTTIDVYSG